MQLLDVADVSYDARLSAHGDELTSRECGAEIRLVEYCGETPDETAVIGTSTSVPGAFKTMPFAIDVWLRRGNFCAQPDDLQWLTTAFRDKLDFVLTWMLTIQHATGSEAWIGDDNVQSTALAGSTAAQRVAGIMAARRQWLKSVVTTGRPILHLPPSWAPDMKAAGLLEDVDTTITKDKVVTGDGYDEKGIAFWSGPIGIKIGKINPETVNRSRTNDQINVVDTFAQFFVSPCSIVRVGAYA